jgi:uncharacterized membrane protein
MVSTFPAVGVTDKNDKSFDSSALLQDAASPTRKTDDWWIWELFGVVVSAIAIVGIAILLFFFNGKPAPRWSHYIYHGQSFNAILSALSIVARICLLIPITRGLAQLKWVWFAEKRRVLTDLTYFEAASNQNLLNSFKLARRLKGR